MSFCKKLVQSGIEALGAKKMPRYTICQWKKQQNHRRRDAESPVADKKPGPKLTDHILSQDMD